MTKTTDSISNDQPYWEKNISAISRPIKSYVFIDKMELVIEENGKLDDCFVSILGLGKSIFPGFIRALWIARTKNPFKNAVDSDGHNKLN